MGVESLDVGDNKSNFEATEIRRSSETRQIAVIEDEKISTEGEIEFLLDIGHEFRDILVCFDSGGLRIRGPGRNRVSEV